MTGFDVKETAGEIAAAVDAAPMADKFDATTMARGIAGPHAHRFVDWENPAPGGVADPDFTTLVHDIAAALRAAHAAGQAAMRERAIKAARCPFPEAPTHAESQAALCIAAALRALEVEEPAP